MSRLETNYTITWAGGTYTITYASTYSPVSFGDSAYIAYVIPNSSAYINVGQADAPVTLDWNKNTNLSPSSANNLITLIAALTSASATYTTLNATTVNADTVSSLTTGASLVLLGNGAGRVEVNDVLWVDNSLIIDSTSNQIALGTTRTATLNAPMPATTNRVYTFPDQSADYSVVATEGAQTVNGVKTLGSAPVAPSYTATATTNQLLLGTTNTYTVSATAPAASRVITLADPGAAASFVMSEGAQTVNGLKTLGTGFVLPTSGGTASTLNYFDERAFVTSTFTGPWTGTQNMKLSYVRFNNWVIVYWDGINANGNSIGSSCVITNTASGVLAPTNFRPVLGASTLGPLRLINVINAATRQTGLATMSTAGVLDFYGNEAAGLFANASTAFAIFPDIIIYSVA